MADAQDLALVSDDALIGELKRRYDTLILYGDRALTLASPEAGAARHELQRVVRGGELAALGLARLIWNDANDALEHLRAELADAPPPEAADE